MCFSATLPPKVDEVVRCILSPGYTSLSTLDPNETPTADKVPQFSIIVPDVADQFAALYSLIQIEYKLNPDDFKAIVFGTTANGVAAYYNLFSILFPQFQTFQLQSRMSQPARTKTTEDFKKAKAGILFASDVVGRGMDFPNVGLVVQVGLPSGEDQYIHRIGRTARAGKDGRATIILAENEAFFLKVNKKLPVKPYPEDVVSTLSSAQPQVDRAFNGVDDSIKSKAYLAWMGFNKMYLKKLQLDNVGLVKSANRLAASMGCPEPPAVEKRTIGKMGLKGVPGLRFQQGDSSAPSRGPPRRNQGPSKETNGRTTERRRKANAW
jgi:ATP-dependent RNA helicase MSS116